MQTSQAVKHLDQRIEELTEVLSQLDQSENIADKLKILGRLPSVKKFSEKPSALGSLMGALTQEKQYLLKQVVAIGQIDRIIPSKKSFSGDEFSKIQKFLQWLSDFDYFYREIGGILGYHLMVIKLLAADEKEPNDLSFTYCPPKYVDISKASEFVEKAVAYGLNHLPFVAEMYPLGGAADRLHLVDPETKRELPAAKLRLGSVTLLETLIRDLQAREYLYYKIYGKRLQTPVAFMTSHEKGNHEHVLSICEKNEWFHRSKKKFRFFAQPLVPTVMEDGNWCVPDYYAPLCKPGGHGIIWKLANDEGVLDWLMDAGAKKALVRQINNPIAGIDYGLLAFLGCGFQKDALFGFASCKRTPGVAEGINVLAQKKWGDHSSYCLSNIEYCDFKHHKNSHELETSMKFPANTNILFADLQGLKNAVEKCPLPGALINLKTVRYKDSHDEMRQAKVARLESTMQNIADVFEEDHEGPAENVKIEKTFVTFNERHKTISTAKKVYQKKSTLETPERCFYDKTLASHELFEDYCGFDMPKVPTVEQYFAAGPHCIIEYHPALGPTYSIIRQKLKKGKIAPRSYLSLEVAEVDIENLDLEGSLFVHTDYVMGHLDKGHELCYSEQNGKCTLKNVTVHNLGAKWEEHAHFWRGNIASNESLQILLHGNAEFYAEDVAFEGNLRFEVPHNISLEISSCKENGYVMKERSLSKPSWYYEYFLTPDLKIQLKKKTVL